MPLGNPIRKQNESRMVSVLATEGQTVFTVQGGYIINHISVFRNGVRLSPAEDFTAGDGSTVTLNNAANIDDRIDFHIFDRFTVQNAIIGAASTQTINGDLVLNGKLFGQLDVPSINLTGIITATELDLNGKGDISSDLKVGGATTTGRLTVTANTVLGNSSSDTVTITGDLDLNGQLDVSGISTFTGLVDANGGAHIDNLRLGIGADNEINTSSGNLNLDSAGGTVDVNASLNVTGVSTFTGNIFISDRIYHTGDTNTQIRFPAVDTFTVETAGSERLRVSAAGVLGVRTTPEVWHTDRRAVQIGGACLSGQNPADGQELALTNNAYYDSSDDRWEFIANDDASGIFMNNGGISFKRSPSSGTADAVLSWSESMFITDTGNLKIGGGTHSRKLAVHDSTNSVILIEGASNGTSSLFFGDENDEDVGMLTYNHASNFLSFTTNTSEALRIDSSGRLLIGHTSSLAGSSSNSQFSFQVLGTSFATSTLNAQRYANDVSGSTIILNKSRGGLGNHTIVQNNDELGKIRFYGSDGNDFDNYAAEIRANVDAAPGNNAMPGRLVFSTTTTGSPSAAERMRIDSQGRVKIHGVGATISDHSVGVTHAPLYLQTVSDMSSISQSEGSATTGMFRMYDVSTTAGRYHGIELRNKNNGDVRILNQDRDTSDRGDLVIAMPQDGNSGGVQEKIRISGLFDSVNIAGKGGATLLGPSDSGYNKQKVDLYMSTKTGVTAIGSQAGDEVAGLIRFEDTGSSNNRFHGIELRNRNSGDARILNKDIGAANKADLAFAVDNGSTVIEAGRFLNTGGLAFNGDTAAANGLDDYEEGSYTPVIYYDSGNNHTYSEQVGLYTKIGNFVYGTIAITWDDQASTGQVGVSLPFNTANVTGTRSSGYCIYQDGLNIPSGQGSTHLILYGGQNTSSTYFYFTGGTNNSELGGSATQLTNSHTSTQNTFRIAFHYRTS